MNEMEGIAAIILGAGLSTRMGQNKLMLPWQNTTILGQTISTLAATGIQDIIVVIQPTHDQLAEHIQQLSSEFPVRIVHNNSFNPEDMVTSIQYGLKEIQSSFKASLIVLGDQPQIQEYIVHQIIQAYIHKKAPIVIPSFSKRRGHPWLISHTLWRQFIQLEYPMTPRDFLDIYTTEIKYVIVDNDSILKDIDTPEDYQFFLQLFSN